MTTPFIPHLGLVVSKDHERFEDGSRIVDLKCIGCDRVWKNVNLAHVSRGNSVYCDACEAKSSQAWEMASAAWKMDGTDHYYCERTGNRGVYGLYDDILCVLFGRQKPDRLLQKFLDRLKPQPKTKTKTP